VIRPLRALGRLLRCGWFLTHFTLRWRWKMPPRDGAEYEAWRRGYFQGAASGLLDGLGIDVEVDGSFPREGGILVTNHLGYVDVLVLASLGPSVFVSRADVEHWPLIGRLTRWCGTIYIDRERRDQIPDVIRQMRGALDSGSQVVFFPEGTSGSGDGVMAFRASLFDVATRGEIPIRVGALTYRTPDGEPPARDAVCWWGDASFARHLFGLAGLREVSAHVAFPDRVFRGTQRKQLAGECQAAITEIFVPVTGSEAAS
jgi:1-acyl-sn-glycerol-3-phosphate acyltransferase